jgi:telomerase reverse transcriptase
MDMLEDHIKNNVVRIGKNYFKQVTGIPQGSIVSTALCNVYFGKYEQDELETISIDKDSLLLRYMDDFIYISTRLGLAQEFLRITNIKRSDIGFSVNSDKTLANFEYSEGGVCVNQVEDLKLDKLGLTLFPWCGQLIEMQQLDVLLDYSRYQNTGMLMR